MIRRSTLAAMLAGGLMFGGAMLSMPAAAKDKPEAAKAQGNSKAFAHEMGVTQFVRSGMNVDVMLASINLDDQPLSKTNEIDNAAAPVAENGSHSP
jgi:hypothetical protein